MASASCPYITNANIAIRGLGFSLFSIKWQYQPMGEQSVLVQYRKEVDITWINVSTNLKVDIYGNIQVGSIDILTPAEINTVYEIRFVNQCGSIEYIQKFLFSYNLFSDSFVIDNALYNICGNDPVTLYSAERFGTGVTMFTNINLTTEVTGYSYIGLASGGSIFNLNSATAVVGSDTTYTCRASFLLKALIDNSTGTICSQTITNIYADGSAEAGIFLFTDAAMSIPLTGYIYVVFIGDATIYNVNNATGEVTGTSGSACTAFSDLYYYAKVENDISSATPTKLYTNGSFGKGAIMYTDYAASSPLTGYNFISKNGAIRTISSTTGEVGCIATEC